MSARQISSGGTGEVICQSNRISIRGGSLESELCVPGRAEGLVIFVHGCGSGRTSPRNEFVAQSLQAANTATLLFDLLTPDETAEDIQSGELRFNIPFLAERLVTVARWVSLQQGVEGLRLGFFGSSTGAAAALVAAASLGGAIDAVVSRGGRPELAVESLPRVKAATLLIVGGADALVLQLNRHAYDRLRCRRKLEIIPGASHLFEEEHALQRVAELAARWFHDHWKHAAAVTSQSHE